MPIALIVDDEPEANKLLGMLIKLRGYQTKSAFTGGEALQCVRNTLPDIIFLDLMLPDLDGFEVCEILKSSKPISLIPLVIVTARIAVENRIESFRRGADDYISKPYTPDQIYEALEQAATWCQQVSAEQVHGVVSLGGHDDEEIFRRLAQLRRLVLARSSLNLESVTRISLAIKELCSFVVASARNRQVDPGASLSYALTADRLILTFCDRIGRLEGFRAAFQNDQNDAFNSLAAAGFDQIIPDTSNHCLTLIKHLIPG
jgi:CheY-like chemotaxis protein